MKFLLFLALFLASCAMPIGQSTPEDRPAKITPESQSEQPSSRELNIIRARTTFAEAKHHFLKGLPEGYELIVEANDALIYVDRIEAGDIMGFPVLTPQYVTEDLLKVYEDEITDWSIVRKGDHSRLADGVALLTPVRSGTGITCSEARLVLDSSTRDEAIGECGKRGFTRLCGDEGVWAVGSCKWDNATKSHKVDGFMFFGCCGSDGQVWNRN